ncbi:MAG: bacillithiol biosynthesis deacetylase BshB1 [bacterium]|nr:bacillithiol biosynthesis deacetylase BshB1 [bacterium]
MADHLVHGDITSLDLLSIAAHPDDCEITSGGLLIKSVEMGRSVGALDLTQGEMGTFGDENDRMAELKAAADIMGLTYRGNLKMPDSAVEYNQANKLMIAQVIRDTRPEAVILPHWEQRHPDHLACCRLAYDACFLAGLKKIDLNGEPFRPHKILYAYYYRNREFSFLTDISEQFEKKCEAVLAYKSQFGSTEQAGRIFEPGQDIVDLMRTRAHHFGQLVGVKYAEAYTIKEQILIDDPQMMPVRSI